MAEQTRMTLMQLVESNEGGYEGRGEDEGWSAVSLFSPVFDWDNDGGCEYAYTAFPDDERLLKAKEVQELLGTGRTKTYEMMNSGELPVVHLGDRSTRVPLKALLKWLQERTTGGTELNN